MKNIILVNGKKRSGKDTFSELLSEKGFYKFAFADSIKEIVCDTLNIDVETLDDYKNSEKEFEIDFEEFKTRLIKKLLSIAKINNYKTDRIKQFDIKTLNIYTSNYTKINIRLFLQQLNVTKYLFNDNGVWVKHALKKIEESEAKDIVISDFRFLDEYELMKKLNFNIICIKIIGKNYYEKDNLSHISETELNDFQFDYHINNTIWYSGSLFWQAQGIIHELQRGENNEH